MALRTLKRADSAGDTFSNAILDSLSEAVVVVDANGLVHYANLSAEQFFGVGRARLVGHPLSEFVPEDTPLFSLLDQVMATGGAVAENGVTLTSPRIGNRFCALRLSPIIDSDGLVSVSLVEQSIARSIDRQMSNRSAARSVSALAAMLAHEVKNPLSGISGAAQLLEQNASEPDRELTRLIRQEADRICALVDQMDQFGEEGTYQTRPVNIHEVLGHVRKLAQGGFGRHVRFTERYDPSLPPAAADRNGLVQVFLNLVKNACEAVPPQGGEVIISTAYRHGVRVNVPGTRERMSLPLEISVADNGPGIPEELRAYMFDAFVTTKPGGTGLGLALVAKVVRDLRGVVEFDSEPRRTVFRVRLPIYQQQDETPARIAQTGEAGHG